MKTGTEEDSRFVGVVGLYSGFSPVCIFIFDRGRLGEYDMINIFRSCCKKNPRLVECEPVAESPIPYVRRQTGGQGILPDMERVTVLRYEKGIFHGKSFLPTVLPGKGRS